MSKSTKISLLFFLIFLIGIIGIIFYVNKTLNKNSLSEDPIRAEYLAGNQITHFQVPVTSFPPSI